MTCGNRDNYNVSARFRRDAGRIPVITKPPPFSPPPLLPPPPVWNRPAGGDSTLMLAPLTGNHPQSVFQSVSLLFNYPFKPYNLGGTMPRAGNDTRGKSGREIRRRRAARGGRASAWNVGSRADRPALYRRRCVGIGIQPGHRDKDGRQLCCETTNVVERF